MSSSVRFPDAAAIMAATAKKLKASGLSVADAVKLAVKPMLAAQVAISLPDLPVARAGFKLPYWDLFGKPSRFYRFRYLEYGDQNGFAAVATEGRKLLRYAQPPNTLNELYLAPFVKWNTIAADPDKELIITEGELKAACATRLGLPTVGLGGVWNFRSAAANLPLLPGFEAFRWEGRRTYICYDSDASSNAQVLAAESALARALFARGAVPFICILPALSKEAKTGLDDYLVGRGQEAFEKEVLAKATEWAAARELFALNEEVVYVTDPGLILRYDNYQRMAPQNFVNHAYSNRIYYEQVVTEKSVKMTERSAPKEWIKWPLRSSVKRITYLPGGPKTTDAGEFNMWRGWGATSKKGDITPFRLLLDFLFKDAPHENRKWFEQWLAYPLRHPGVKLYSASLLWGVNQGTGKSLLGYTMFQIYGQNATEIGDRDLLSTHNEWAENKQFAMGDEITGGDKRSSADRMKSMLTQLWLRINAKYISAYSIPDCINYFFTSNHPDSLFLEDTDRRFFIHEVQGRPLAPEFYRDYVKWLGLSASFAGDSLPDRGADYLFHYLLHLDLSGFNPAGHAPATRSKMNMIEAGRSDLGTWVAALREDPDGTTVVGGKLLPYKLWTTSELFAIFDPNEKGRVTLNGLSRELSRAGFRKAHLGAPVRTSSGLVKLWAIRDIDAMLAARASKLVEIYESERGISGKKKTKF